MMKIINGFVEVEFYDTGFDKLSKELNKNGFKINSFYDKTSDITKCNVTGNNYDVLMKSLITLEDSIEMLVVGGKTNHSLKTNSIDANYSLNIEGDKIQLSYSGTDSNIISLTPNSINLYNLLNDHGYDAKISFQDKKIKFDIRGGAGIDQLADLVWESENGSIDPDFEQIPYADKEGYVKPLYRLKTKNSIIEYLGSNHYE